MMDMVSFSPELDADPHNSEYTAYMELWSAVLRCAISDIENDLKRRKKATRTLDFSSEAKSAIAWIADDSPRRFGFRWVCFLFSLDPIRVRQQIFTTLNVTL